MSSQAGVSQWTLFLLVINAPDFIFRLSEPGVYGQMCPKLEKRKKKGWNSCLKSVLFSLAFPIENRNKWAEWRRVPGLRKSQPVKAELKLGWRMKGLIFFIQRCCLETQRGTQVSSKVNISESAAPGTFFAEGVNNCVFGPCRKSGGRILQVFSRRRWRAACGGVKRWLLTRISLQPSTQ